MITLFSNNFNNKYQHIYDSLTQCIHLFSLKCPCGHSGHCIRYGFYTRSIKTPEGLVPLRIQRVLCKHCNHTHALLLSSIIPYSRILLRDAVTIIQLNSSKELDEFMISNPLIDESNVSYIRKQYIKHWQQRLLSENISFDDCLVFQCFSHFSRQFMQIKCIQNILYSFTNIT